ncbi:hypothetical protein NYE62_09780 [Bacillus sp. FSL K6-2861]|uniref:hypothetical protein n=1 Tax=Bacillus sp. FSL K6-2861 TaxID=2975294 RepID=UPI00315AAC6E
MKNVNQTVINNANTVFEKKDDKYLGYKSRFGDVVIGGAYSYRFVVHYAKTNQDVVIISGDVTPICTTLEERLWKPEKSAQALRDEIVEMAKADVGNLKAYGKQSSRSTRLGNLTYREYYYSVEFKVSSNKRKVSALIYPIGRLGFISGRPIHVGRAKAVPDDCFNVHIGKAIALRRALGLAVPHEYLNAPPPTEIRVGDVVCGKYEESYYRYEGRLFGDSYEEQIKEIEDGKFRYMSGGYDFIDSADLTIIDDSREEVGGE